MESAVVRIKKGEGRSLKAGGMWIYDNEIDTIKGDYVNGDMVFVEDFDGYPLGHGFINTNSRLTVRMMSRKKDTVVNDDFLEMRVRAAWEYRKTTMAMMNTPTTPFIPMASNRALPAISWLPRMPR